MLLYCRTYSSGNVEELYQPPIIFLHGMALSGTEFKKVAPVIAEKTKRKVYVPDIRNHGKSPWVKEMNYDILTNDVLELMLQNKIAKAILIGSSMGGRIAMNFALKYPQKVEILVVVEMTPRNITSSGDNFIQIVYKFVKDILNSLSPDADLNDAKKKFASILIDFVPGIYVDKEKAWANYDPDFVTIIKDGNRFRLECNADVVSNMLENDTLIQNLPVLGNSFDGDTLFLYGSKGFFNLDKDPSIKRLFPKAIIKKIEGASHLIHIDSSEEFINNVVHFILHRKLPESKY